VPTRCWLILGAALLLGGCATYTKLPPEERATLERDLTGRSRAKFLRLSYYVVPFFGDASKRLLTAVPPDEVRLLNHPNGTPVNPGQVEKILPAGTRARITQVEFPTSWVMTERVPYTPRTQPWVYLEVEGEPSGLPYVLVLRPQLDSPDDFRAELGRFLADEDLAPTLQGWSEAVREAVRTKMAVTEMPADALEMAWGYPELKRISLEGETRTELWVYPDRRRVAHLSDGRLVRAEVGGP
jgi:hypothetical protein